MQGERTGAGQRQEGGEADSGTDTVGLTVNGSAKLIGKPGQVVVPAELRADVSAHGFWKRGTTAMFDIRVVNLDAGSYLRMTPEKTLAKALAKALSKAEKEKKDLYLQACLECRRTFTLMVYSADEIPGAEALAAQKRSAALLSYKLKRKYLEMCGKPREGLSPESVNALKSFVHSSNNIYNTLINFATHSRFRIEKQNKKKRSINWEEEEENRHNRRNRIYRYYKQSIRTE